MPSKELRRYREIEKDINPDDIQPINSMICACVKNTKGRPAIYPNNDNGLDSFVQNSINYFEYVENANSQIEEPKRQLILDIDSWCVYLGISRNTLKEYQQRSESWNKTISYFRDVIGSSKKQLAMHGLIPTVMAIFDLSNNHNYYNVSEYKLTTESATKKPEEDRKSLEERVAEAGLVWDSEREEWVYE